MNQKVKSIFTLSHLFYLTLLALYLLGCSTIPPTPTPPLRPTATSAPAPSEQATLRPSAVSPAVEGPATFGYTHQQPDGNRLVSGEGALPNVTPVDIPLAFIPQWLVAAPTDEGSLWVAVTIEGQAQAFQVLEGEVAPVAITPERLPAGMPPLLRLANGLPSLVTPPTEAASQATHPIVLPSSGRLAFTESNGDLVIWDEAEVARLSVNALPDARLLADQTDRLLLLTDPTSRYAHGVLGDQLEAASITLVETAPTPRIAQKISLPEPDVVEGIAPIWVDLTGDGQREIIVTVSNERDGARIFVFDEVGEQVAVGPAIGQGHRWRHQLAVAPFGPAGELELVDVRTPHIGGTVEFYQLAGQTLDIIAKVPGYTSHLIGSYNLDMAVAGDFDGDGQVELLLPDQARTELGGIRRIQEDAEVAWTVPAGGRVTTNLATVTLNDGSLAVGVGYEDQGLRIWQR